MKNVLQPLLNSLFHFIYTVVTFYFTFDCMFNYFVLCLISFSSPTTSKGNKYFGFFLTTSCSEQKKHHLGP